MRLSTRSFRKCLFLVLALASTGATLAWDGTQTDRVGTVEVNGGSNHNFRFYLETPQVMCTAGATWAYLDESDANYEVFVAVILTAQAQGKTMVIYTTNVGAYCKVGYLQVIP